eukprot:XP_019075546.1 PREDICTED: probable protein phosphatase 2C 34 isoform X2 [Vitis vinifera]
MCDLEGRPMENLLALFDALMRNISLMKGESWRSDVGREAAESLAKEARGNNLMLTSPGIINSRGSSNFASVFSKKGKKGVNQDCFIVWEEFGCQEDMTFCGIFDGHGLWGHHVAKRVRKLMPSFLLCHWQETLALAQGFDMMGLDRNLCPFDIWRQSYLKTCAAIDEELEQHADLDSFRSGTTALTIVRQGELIIIANVGDSRAVLGTTSDDGSLVAVQLTVDFKPNLPQEAERITKSRGQVYCLQDEPGVYRVWMPNTKTPGLAISRAFGDYCMKDFGVISVPEVTQRNITSRDQFAILATDGVWDVISNQEAVEIVSSAPDRNKSAKRLVECAVDAWKRKKRGVATDDITAICLFFHPSPSQQGNNAKVLEEAGMTKAG